MRDRRAPRFLRLERRYFNFDELLYRLLPAFDSGEDAVWVGGPDEEFGIGLCLSDKAVDSDLEVNDGSEHAALEATARELGEEAFDRMEPGCGGRGEVERPAGMPGQPLAHLRMLVGRIVVDDGVDHFSHGNLLLDRVEEADELLMAVALHVAADDSAVKDVEGCEADQGADFIKSCFAGGKSARKAVHQLFLS